MDKKLQQFINKEIIPTLETRINYAKVRILEIDFKIPKLEEKLKELENPPILSGDRWQKQLEEHQKKRRIVQDEIEKMKQEKEELLENIRITEEFVEYLRERGIPQRSQ